MSSANNAPQTNLYFDLPGKPFEVEAPQPVKSFKVRWIALFLFVFIAAGTTSARLYTMIDAASDSLNEISMQAMVDDEIDVSPLTIIETAAPDRVVLPLNGDEAKENANNSSPIEVADSKRSRLIQVTEKLTKMSLLEDQVAELEAL